ncbi:hypothetical protein [Rugamonas sp.]|nr:hypothetical protein [Rugamonas sp.]
MHHLLAQPAVGGIGAAISNAGGRWRRAGRAAAESKTADLFRSAASGKCA